MGKLMGIPMPTAALHYGQKNYTLMEKGSISRKFCARLIAQNAQFFASRLNSYGSGCVYLKQNWQ